MRVLIPFKAQNPKTRLSGVMTLNERISIAEAMLYDVIQAVEKSGVDVIDIGVTKMNFVCRGIDTERVNIIYAPYSLDDLVNDYLAKVVEHRGGEGVAVVMADLPLLKAEHIKDIIEMGAEVVLAPGRFGGTNILFTSVPRKFRVSYYEMSFIKHFHRAEQRGLTVKVYDSFYTSVDVDSPDDLVEVLLHSKGYAKEVLEDMGFFLESDGALVLLKRE